MSIGTFGHARRTLDIIEEQKLEADHIETLHSGYLVDLARAVRLGTVPARDAFQKFLGLLPELKIWKTIKLGLRKTPAEYEEALEKKGFRIGDYARQILKKITISQIVVELDLGVLIVAELGFKGNARYQDICRRVVEIGGELCPNEAGPALREQYPDQPYGEWDTIAMEPLIVSVGALDVFHVARDSDGRWLGAYYGDPDDLFFPGHRVVFVVPRK